MAYPEPATPPPPDGGEPPLLEPADRLDPLRAFLLTHYEIDPDDPRAQVDGHQMAIQFAVAATDAGLDPPIRTRFYQDLRSLGFLVGPGTGNRTRVVGLRPRPHAANQLAALESRWPTIADDLAAYRTQRHLELAASSVAGTLQFTRAVVEEAADVIVETMRSAKDQHLRARMATLILDRSVPTVRARDQGPEPIDARVPTARPILTEVEQMIRARMGDERDQGSDRETSDQGARDDVQGSTTTQGAALPPEVQKNAEKSE